MRSSGFDHAKPTGDESTLASVARGRTKKRGVVKYQGSTMQRVALMKAEDKAKEIWEGLEVRADLSPLNPLNPLISLIADPSPFPS